ncbi:MAG: hypothetical protein WC516_07440 [Patescibacteria group bacterium]
MNRKAKSLLFFLLIILLIILSTPIFGFLYQKIIGRQITSWFWGPAHPAYLEGFFMSLMFFVPALLVIYNGVKKYKIILVIVAVVLLFFLMLGFWEGIIIDLVTAIVGWLIGEVVLLVYKKCHKK